MTSALSVPSSTSERLRRKGNEQFSTVQSLPPELQASRLMEALVWYNKALAAAFNIADILSALKNVAVASSKLSRLTVNIKSEQVVFYAEQSISSFTKALSVAESDASRKEWCDDVKKRLYDQVSHYLDLLDDQYDTVREQKQLALCKQVHVSAKSLCFFDLAKMYFRRALVFQEEKKFEKSLPLFGECYGPLTEASRYLSSAYEDVNNVSEFSIEDLQDQVHVTEAVAKALQAIHVSDALFKKAVFEAEILDVNLLWDCVDWYQQAIVYSNIYNDLETEAIASCHIGIIYLRVLKLTEKGYLRLKHSFDLAESMKPRYFVNDEWYKQCVAAMQEYQTEKRRKEEEEQAKSKALYLEKLKDELALIREKSEKSPYDLLKHVYEKHPPKNDAKLPDEIKPEQLKKTLQLALTHYHPDKNAEGVYGMEWSVLAEEICKYISSHYERQKGEEYKNA